MYILDHCLSPLTLLHLKICCCPSLNTVILLTVHFDKEFMLPISVSQILVYAGETKKEKPNKSCVYIKKAHRNVRHVCLPVSCAISLDQ